MSFTQQLWKESEGVYEQILSHPFNQALMKGNLDAEPFKFYINQDALYLQDFGRALALIGARSSEPSKLQQFANFAEGTVLVERELHNHYFQKFAIEPTSTKSPTCTLYTNFLLSKAALEPYEVGIAALLPCFWIYREVGNHIYNNAAGNNPYQDWIDTYAGEEFSQLVDQALNITDEVAQSASSTVKESMHEAFLYSTRLEWMFWDSAYRQEPWPV
jgi:thiaminase/transcriptional activator TenA